MSQNGLYLFSTIRNGKWKLEIDVEKAIKAIEKEAGSKVVFDLLVPLFDYL